MSFVRYPSRRKGCQSVRHWIGTTCRQRHRFAAAACLALALTATGCTAGQLQFSADHRLHFVSPKNRSLAALPVMIQWTMTGFTLTGADGQRNSRSGSFAIFVDTQPIPVGKDLRWLGRNDRSCKEDPTCPNAQFLADRHVYVTTTPELTLDQLPRPVNSHGREDHVITVVLLDGTNHRIGESGWTLTFHIKRRPL